MEGLYIVRKDDPDNLNSGAAGGLTLLLKRPDLEIMLQSVVPEDTIWIAAAEDQSMIEIFVLLSGSVEIHRPEGGVERMRPGDMFYVDHLAVDVRISATEASSMLYITTQPVFDDLCAFQRDLSSLLVRINDKDRITLTHSRNVKRYTVALYDYIKPEGILLDDIVSAALFHDVGKCYVPGEILTKHGKLTPEEFELIKQHAQDSYEILSSCFGEKVAELARGHHERLDGSGYPAGVSGADIGIGSRIIAVVDAYDAMTSPRTYNRIKTPEAAIAELEGLPDKYDSSVVAALKELYRMGKVTPVTDGLTPDEDVLYNKKV